MDRIQPARTINEDGVSTFNLRRPLKSTLAGDSRTRPRVITGMDFSIRPSTKIDSNVKWVFFEQVARLKARPFRKSLNTKIST